VERRFPPEDVRRRAFYVLHDDGWIHLDDSKDDDRKCVTYSFPEALRRINKRDDDSFILRLYK
jgi:hypothetical protein